MDPLLKFAGFLQNLHARSASDQARMFIYSCYVEILEMAKSYQDDVLNQDFIEPNIVAYLGELSAVAQLLSYLESLSSDSNEDSVPVQKYKIFVETFQRLTSSINILNDCTIIFDETVKSLDNSSIEDEEKIDKAVFILDKLDTVVNLTKDNLKLFCKIKCLDGKIFLTLLGQPDSARNCFKEVVELGTVENFVGEVWFKEAKIKYQELRKQKDEDCDEKDSEGKAEILKELKDELSKLDEGIQMNLDAFVDHLFTHFPVKHKQNCKKTCDSER